jgi:hypothetical protein
MLPSFLLRKFHIDMELTVAWGNGSRMNARIVRELCRSLVALSDCVHEYRVLLQLKEANGEAYVNMLHDFLCSIRLSFLMHSCWEQITCSNCASGQSHTPE